jgi:hypothetical protein
MTKKDDGSGFVNPASLWGKPLPKMLQPTTPKGSTEPKKEKNSGMGRRDSEDIDLDSDVDDELEGTGPSDDELLDGTEEEETTEETYVEASVAVEVTDDEAEDEDDDDEAEDEAEEEADVEDVVEVDEAESAVDEADDEEVEPTRRSHTVAEKKKKSMSDYVRDEIAKRTDAGDSLRGVDIVNALAKKGVKVSPAQVSQLLKKAGISAKARGPKKHKAAAAPAATTSEASERSRMAMSRKKTSEKKPAGRPANKVATAVAGTLPVTHLKAAKAFLTVCGDYEEAARILKLHEQLQDVMSDIG